MFIFANKNWKIAICKGGELFFKVIYTSSGVGSTCALLQQIAGGRVNLNYATQSFPSKEKKEQTKPHHATCVLPLSWPSSHYSFIAAL